jgi:iron-sulfur cluster assembly accessory protein
MKYNMSRSILTITRSATKKLSEIIKANNSKAIFFDIKGGGCNGFEYRFTPVASIEHERNLIDNDGLKIEVCDKSLLYLLGTKIDWKSDIMGEGFKFENPMAGNSCGCGTSFSPIEKNN